MNLTNEELQKEFKRQVYLCSGLGRKEMQSILDNHAFENETTISVTRKIGRIRASVSGALDGLELDNTSDVVEKSIVIEQMKDILTIVDVG